MIYIYLSLIIKGILNLLFLVILLISSGNIKILKNYQKKFLVISIIEWFLIVVNYFCKFGIILASKILKKKFHCQKRIKMLLKLSWYIINISAYIIMSIAFIYDVIQILKGNLTYILYECIFCTLCIIFTCFTINDYYHLEIIYFLIVDEIEIKKETKEIKQSRNSNSIETKIEEEDQYEFDLKVLGNKIQESYNRYNLNKQKAL